MAAFLDGYCLKQADRVAVGHFHFESKRALSAPKNAGRRGLYKTEVAVRVL